MSRQNKTKIFILIITLFIIFCSGCSDINFSDNTLIRPPRATGDKAEIQNIISKEAAGSYTLKYPQRGEYRSAIIMYESENLGECAIALYSTESDVNIHVSIMSYTNGKWSCSGTFVNSGAGVERVMFCDIDGDEKDEIIIGCNTYNSSLKTLTIYKFEIDGGIREITVDDTYDEIIVADITDNKVDDVILLSLSTADVPSSIKLLQYSEQEKRPIGKFYLELDPNVTNFLNILVGKIDENKNGIVIDGEKSGGILATQIIYFDDKERVLMNPLVTVSYGTVTNITNRKDIITSRDMDSDGIIEVPVTTQMAASEDEVSNTICSITSWKQLVVPNNTLKTKLNTVINYTDGYYFIFPDKWNSKVTARTNPDNREMSFYLWNDNTNSSGDKLLTIYRFTPTEWNDMEIKDFIHLDTVTDGSTNAVFAAKIFVTNAKDSLNISKDEVIYAVKSIN